MDLAGATIALYGRFTPGARSALTQRIGAGGGAVVGDLTRGAGRLVVGALATALIDSGALAQRLSRAAANAAPVEGEHGFSARLAGAPAAEPPTLPLAAALAGTRLGAGEAEVLAAFDLIGLVEGRCRFADAATIRAAAELIDAGRSLGETVRILGRARDIAPRGRRKISLDAAGEAVLEWEDGRTTLEGQGYLPLGDDDTGVDDFLEGAALAEAAGALDAAARLYDLAARADRRDPVALYNLGNVRLAQKAHAEAALAYRRALSRDERLVEARYNLAQALEACGRPEEAAAELETVIAADPAYADALFNLAQLRLKADRADLAERLFARYLALDPPPEAAEVAKRALLYCAAARG